jgi:GTP cyclohydrolase IA
LTVSEQNYTVNSHDGAQNRFDRDRVMAAVAELLDAIGEDTQREGLIDTPRRIADMYAEILGGMATDPGDQLSVRFSEGHDELVLLRDIPFYSLCEHHFLPFHGVAHVGYIPHGSVVGISKLARVVELFARRPQLQERLTGQIADCIIERLQPRGVGVVVEAEHLCMTMRGVKKPGSRMVTSAVRGSFADDERARAEFLALVRGGHDR